MTSSWASPTAPQPQPPGPHPPAPPTPSPAGPPFDAAVARLAAPPQPYGVGLALLAIGTLYVALFSFGAAAILLSGSPPNPASALAGMLAYSAAFAVAVVAVRRAGGWQAALGLGSVRWWDVPVGVLAGLALLIVQAAAIAAAQQLPFFRGAVPENAAAFGETSGLTFALLAVSAVVFAPVVEEVLFRGLLLRGLAVRSGFWSAAIVSSVVFGLLHVVTGTGGLAAMLLLALPTGLLGFVNCLLVRWTDRLAPAITLHALRNGLAVAVLAGVSG